MVKQYAWIGVFGAAGALSRWFVSMLLAPTVKDPSFPWGTWVCNLLGCFLIGLLASCTTSKMHVWRSRLMGGFAGAFTTFSAFSAENLHLIETNHYVLAAVYVVSSFIFGWMLFVVGLHIGGKMMRKQAQP